MILAIDPGNAMSGWVLVENDLSGIVKKGKTENNELLQVIRDLAASSYPIDHVAIEMIASYGMAVGKSVFETCVWIGRFQQICLEMFGQDAKLIYRMEEKMVICHDSKAKDSNIWQGLKDRFGDPGKKKNPGLMYGLVKDARMAFAVAVVLHDKYLTDIYKCYF